MTNARQLDAGIVAVLDVDDKIAGTGFLAAGRLVLTCAHVVEEAGSGPGEAIKIRFHHGGAIHTVQVHAGYWRSPDGDDIAVLELAGDAPHGASPLPLGESSGCDGHAFRTLGYPLMGDYVGIGASGEIERSVTRAGGSQMLQLTSSQLAQGHSGAPVWDEAQEQVVGMISEVWHPLSDSKNRDTAFATPGEALRQACPLLTLQPPPPPKPESDKAALSIGEMSGGQVFHIEGGIHAGRDVIQGDQVNIHYQQSIANIQTPAAFIAELHRLRATVAMLKMQPDLSPAVVRNVEIAERQIEEAAEEAQKPRPLKERIASTLAEAKDTIELVSGALKSAVGLGTIIATLIEAAHRLFGG